MEQFPFEDKNFLGDRLRELRLTFGFKQEDVARMLNISRSTYSYYETGATRPDPAVLGKLAEYYDVSVEAFYNLLPLPEMSLRDFDRRRYRSPRAGGLDPDRVGELRPAERSLILLLRSNGYVTAEGLLDDLEDYVDRMHRIRRDQHII